MSILSHRDEFLDLYKYSKNKEFEPSKPTKETDVLGFTYTNKSNEAKKMEIEEPITLTDEQITEMWESGYISDKEEFKDGND